MSSKAHRLIKLFEGVDSNTSKEDLVKIEQQVKAIQNEDGGFLSSIGLSGVQRGLDSLTGATATREASAQLSEANNAAISQQEASQQTIADLQSQGLQQQNNLFSQFEQGTQNRFDQLIAQSEQQFQQRSQGIDSRFQAIQNQLSPFLDAGRRSISSIEELIANPGSIKDSAAFKFRLRQGLESAQNSAAARGSGLGGNVLRRLQEVGQQSASQEFQNEFNRRSTLLQAGQNSINQSLRSNIAQGAEQGAAFNQLGQARLGAFGQLGGELTSALSGRANAERTATNNLTNAEISRTSNIASLIANQGQINASSTLGVRQGQIDAIKGAVGLGATIFGGPAGAIGAASLGGGQVGGFTPNVSPDAGFLSSAIGAVGPTNPTFPSFIPR